MDKLFLFDAYALIYFLPEEQEDPCTYLAVTITLTDNVAEDKVADLYRLMNRIFPKESYLRMKLKSLYKKQQRWKERK